MAMNGIDIASYQKGIDLSVVPCDFVIAKATQGTTYVNPDCSRAVEQGLALGKCMGVYHYVSGGDATGEADFFVDSCENWVGRAVFCLDWEQIQNSAWGDEAYLERVARRVIERTGNPPVIYVQQSRMAAVKPVASALDCGLWIAQYANMNQTGYQDSPWNENSYSCAIRQYTSSGVLDGWGGRLDLNKFYGDATAWAAYAGGNAATAQAAPAAPADYLTSFALSVKAGNFGNGTKNRTAQLYHYLKDKVNETYAGVQQTPVDAAFVAAIMRGEYGNEPERPNLIFRAVQDRVNELS
jgi:GH25 family lysozyme M1 (1,4-beta-N-acetylmuramidase)